MCVVVIRAFVVARARARACVGGVALTDARAADVLERVADGARATSSTPWTPDIIDIGTKTPRQWSPIALAFLGDAVWELYTRAWLFNPPTKPLDYDLKTKRLARAEAQDFILRALVDGDTLSEEELSVVKWGRNAAYGNVPTRLRGKGKGGHGTYRNASALECLIGYIYVADRARLEELWATVVRDDILVKALELD